MSISQDSFTFTHDHGVVSESETEVNIVQGKFPGVKGEQHLIDETKGSFLRCTYNITGGANYAALRTSIDTINVKAGKLTGTLTVTGTVAATFAACTFIGFFPTQPPFLDGSGVNGWCAIGELRWRKRGTS